MIKADLPAVAARHALDAAPLNTGFARAVVAGQVNGALWMDRPDRPRVFHALHAYGMSLVWGDAVADAFEAVVSHLRNGRYRTGVEWLQIDPRWQALDWDGRLGAVAMPAPAEAPCIRHTRVNFEFVAGRFPMPSRPGILPGGWRLRPADVGDFALPGEVVPGHFWPDAGRFLAAGGGWCAERDGRVGAIAFVSCRWDDQVEIGIETFAHARRQGLGHAAAVALTAQILQAGLQPVWACRLENAASHALALKLGFEPSRHLPYYRLAVPSDRHGDGGIGS